MLNCLYMFIWKRN